MKDYYDRYVAADNIFKITVVLLLAALPIATGNGNPTQKLSQNYMIVIMLVILLLRCFLAAIRYRAFTENKDLREFERTLIPNRIDIVEKSCPTDEVCKQIIAAGCDDFQCVDQKSRPNGRWLELMPIRKADHLRWIPLPAVRIAVTEADAITRITAVFSLRGKAKTVIASVFVLAALVTIAIVIFCVPFYAALALAAAILLDLILSNLLRWAFKPISNKLLCF